MNKKKVIITAAAVILLITTAIIFMESRKADTELKLYGNIEIRQVDLSFMVPGQIKEMLKEEGDEVNKGDLIALLDDKDFVVNLQKASAEEAKAKAVSFNADSLYERKVPLCEDRTVSPKECDDLFYGQKQAKAILQSATAQKVYAENQLNYTKMYAPEKGIITTRVEEPGATVGKGQTVYTVSKSTPVWIRTYVCERDLGNISYDMKARVFTDSKDPQTGKKREYTGRIGYISPVAEFTPKTVQTEDLRTDLVYRIRVYIDDVDEFLRRGMPVTVKINLLEGKNTTDESN